MKQLTRIRLVNWHLFTDVTITCQGTSYFIGVNGAGKSTILDAVQFALVGGQRDVKFNQAALANSRRTLSSYVRGELGTEGQRYLRDDCTGLVALEFANPDGTRFVHGALVDAYADNHSPDIAYFIVHNAELNDAWFFKAPGQLFDTGSFRRHLEHFGLPSGAKAQTFTRLEDYRANLLNRLGQLRDTFPAKIVKGVAFSPLTNIRDFVHNYLLDEALVDVKTLQEQLETLRHFEKLVADILARIAELDRIESHDAERIANRRRRLTNGFVKRQAEADTVLAGLKRRRLERDEADLSLKRAELGRDGLAESLKLAQEALLQAQLALQTDRTAARQAELRAAIAAAETDLAALRQRKTELSTALEAEAAAMRTLRGLLLADEQRVAKELETLTVTLDGSETEDPATGDALVDAIHATQHLLTALAQTYADQRALLVEKVRNLREEGDRIQREIAQLRTGDRDASYEAEAPAAARLRRLLRAELGLGAEEVSYVCQALDVADEAWQDAVEGVLGPARFHLLIPPAHYDAAVRIYRSRRFKDDLHGVGLLDGDRILAAVRTGDIRRGAAAGAGSDRLAAEVQTGHPVARAYVDLLLGGYVKCDTLEALRDQRQGVTRECFVRRQFSTSHLDPHHYRRWFIGGRAIPRQIAEREARLAALGDELAGLAGPLAGLEQRLSLTRDRVQGFIELERGLPELARLPQAEAALAALHSELAGLDTRTIGALQAEAQRARAAAGEVQERLSQAD
ncbi:MAG: ATP-binding protein, partial [Nitrososphaerales archaeon]